MKITEKQIKLVVDAFIELNSGVGSMPFCASEITQMDGREYEKAISLAYRINNAKSLEVKIS